jgi:hypothetical protein
MECKNLIESDKSGMQIFSRWCRENRENMCDDDIDEVDEIERGASYACVGTGSKKGS